MNARCPYCDRFVAVCNERPCAKRKPLLERIDRHRLQRTLDNQRVRLDILQERVRAERREIQRLRILIPDLERRLKDAV